jgi:replicative DNA helicase
VLAFPVEALPPVLGDRVRDVARVTQTPPDLAGTCGLVTVAAAGARRVDVMIGTTHVEPVNLYALCVAESGTRKTPAQRAMSAPLRAVQAAWQARAKPGIQQQQQRRKIAEKHIEHLSAQAAKASDPADRERLTEEAAQLAGALPPVPPLPTLVVGDRTPEKLEENLAEQGGALLIEDEEAGSLFAIAGGRYSRDGSAQLDVYLKGYDRGLLDTDRISRDLVQCKTPELSISVTPQPIVLRQLRERPEFHHRGLLPRFLFSVPASMVGHRPYDPRQAFDPAAAAAYASMVERVAGLEQRRDGDDLPHLRIEGAALAVWAAYHDRVEREMRDGERLAGIREWASKQPGRVARQAGVLHLIETVAGHSVNSVNSSLAIPPRTVEAACQLGEYFEAHALAAYDVMGTLPQVEGARRVLAWIKRTVPVAFSERDAARGLGVGQGRFFATMTELTPCLGLLVEYGYLRPTPCPGRSGPGQKPSPTFDVQPGFLESCRQNRQNSDSVNSVNVPGGSQPRREPPDSTTCGPNFVPADLLDADADAALNGESGPLWGGGAAAPTDAREPGSDDDDPTPAWAGVTGSNGSPAPHGAAERGPLQLAARHGWPCVPLRKGLTIPGTELVWRYFVLTAASEDLQAALRYLHALRLRNGEAV